MVLKKLRKNLIKLNSKWLLSITEAYRYCTPCVLIPVTEKVIKPQPCWIYRQKTRTCFWSMNQTRPKTRFLCPSNKLQIFKYIPNWANALHWRCQNKFFLSKNEIARQLAYFGENRIIMILVHCYIFVRQTTSKTRHCYNVDTWVRILKSKAPCCNNVSFWSEQRRKLNVVATLWPKIKTGHLDENARNK